MTTSKTVPGFNWYTISEDGTIYSIFRSKPLEPNIKKGYAWVNLKGLAGSYRFGVHQLVATTFIPNPDNLPLVAHLDDDKLNNHVSNLVWSTTLKNGQWAYRTGANSTVGDKHRNKVLSVEVVEIIMLRLVQSESQEDILKSTKGLTRGMLQSILHGRAWCPITYKYGVTPKAWPKHLPFPEGVDTLNWKRSNSQHTRSTKNV